jgi:hypothetical protein
MTVITEGLVAASTPADAPRYRRNRATSGSPDRWSGPERCPLYVRAQLETAGLTWTQLDITAPKAIDRETGKTQLTGYLRRWWQVLGSNQRRLSRRFYREPITSLPNGR